MIGSGGQWRLIQRSQLLESVRIRALDQSDAIRELTALLHRAYKQLGDLGLNFTAVDQSEETTRKRVQGGECLVAQVNDRIVGTVTLHTAKQAWHDGWYGRDGVATFGQFAVEPGFQKQGIGGLLMNHIEERARKSGAIELAMDTAEPASHLIEYYTRRGYRFIEYRQWEGKTYRSMVFSKTLA
jgi:GNAT superfamily N-acetyltransferase